MKITLATALLLGALVVFVKASSFAEQEEENDENLEDELYDLEAWEIEDPAMGPPKPPVNVDVRSLIVLFLYRYSGTCVLREYFPTVPTLTLD